MQNERRKKKVYRLKDTEDAIENVFDHLGMRNSWVRSQIGKTFEINGFLEKDRLHIHRPNNLSPEKKINLCNCLSIKKWTSVQEMQFLIDIRSGVRLLRAFRNTLDYVLWEISTCDPTLSYGFSWFTRMHDTALSLQIQNDIILSTDIFLDQKGHGLRNHLILHSEFERQLIVLSIET